MNRRRLQHQRQSLPTVLIARCSEPASRESLLPVAAGSERPPGQVLVRRRDEAEPRGGAGLAAAVATPPAPTTFVTDAVGFLTATRARPGAAAGRAPAATGQQVVVWIGAMAGAGSMEEWAARSFEAWAWVARARTTAWPCWLPAARQVRIEVGYGLEPGSPTPDRAASSGGAGAAAATERQRRGAAAAVEGILATIARRRRDGLPRAAEEGRRRGWASASWCCWPSSSSSCSAGRAPTRGGGGLLYTLGGSRRRGDFGGASVVAAARRWWRLWRWWPRRGGFSGGGGRSGGGGATGSW